MSVTYTNARSATAGAIPEGTIPETRAASGGGAGLVQGVFLDGAQPLSTGAATSDNQTNGDQKTRIVDLHGHQVNVQQISAVTDGTEYGLLAIAMLHGQDPHGEWKDVKVSHTGALTVEANDGGGSLTVDGSVSATQSGAWNITNISGTVSLPTGAAQDGTDISSPTAMPAGGAGIRGWLSAIWTKLNGTLAATQSGTWTVQPGNTANTTAWKVDGSAVTQPVSGTVTATVSGVATASNQTDGSQKTKIIGTDGSGLDVYTRTQTPTNKVIGVQIGPGDIISNLPVVMQYDHHQIHEGESHRAQDVQSGLGAGTVKYGLTVPTYANTIQAPHLIITADVYNGAVLVQMYEGATFTGGASMTSYNRNRNNSTAPGMTAKTGVTSTNGTLIDSFYVGAGTRASSSNRAAVEWVLKSNTIYRVDVIGQVAGTACIVGFDSYEDLGV